MLLTSLTELTFGRDPALSKTENRSLPGPGRNSASSRWCHDGCGHKTIREDGRCAGSDRITRRPLEGPIALEKGNFFLKDKSVVVEITPSENCFVKNWNLLQIGVKGKQYLKPPK